MLVGGMATCWISSGDSGPQELWRIAHESYTGCVEFGATLRAESEWGAGQSPTATAGCAPTRSSRHGVPIVESILSTQALDDAHVCGELLSLDSQVNPSITSVKRILAWSHEAGNASGSSDAGSRRPSHAPRPSRNRIPAAPSGCSCLRRLNLAESQTHVYPIHPSQHLMLRLSA